MKNGFGKIQVLSEKFVIGSFEEQAPSLKDVITPRAHGLMGTCNGRLWLKMGRARWNTCLVTWKARKSGDVISRTRIREIGDAGKFDWSQIGDVRK